MTKIKGKGKSLKEKIIDWLGIKYITIFNRFTGEIIWQYKDDNQR